jgi:hypothetical protein
MNRQFKREYNEEDLQPVTERTKVGVFSLVRSSGTTYFATSLAKYLAEQKRRPVTFIEMGHCSDNAPLLYDSMGIVHRFGTREFIHFFKEVRNRKYIKQLKNLDGGINWVLRTPDDWTREGDLTLLEEVRLLNNVFGEWIICDLGSLVSAETMDEMDLLIGMIDPLPAKLLSSKQSYQTLRSEELGGRQLLWVINKYNAGINKKLLAKFLKLKDPVTIPLMKEEWFYVAEYHCKLPYEQVEIKNETSISIEELVKRHILFT